ncbi:MAG: hypothetical protein KDD55_10190 [Bdellovibrionales bacterium]|nr:hypothetical protein [Bdellovibrionales bacterium]
MLCLLLFGCHHTTLSPDLLPPEAFRLASSGTPLSVELVSSDELRVGGTQYALLLLPFGSVSLTEPELYVEQVLYRELALAGFRPDFHRQTQLPLDLKVEIEQLRSTAYDFIFVRKIVASAKLSFTLSGDSGTTVLSFDSFESESEYRKYGFEQDLRIVLNRAIQKAFSPLVQSLSRFRKENSQWG